MIRLSALAAILLQVAVTAALATEVLVFEGAEKSDAHPTKPIVIAGARDKAHVHRLRTIFDQPSRTSPFNEPD